MRAQPATSEERRLAAQLVAYGGSRAGSMREGAHPGRIAANPAQDLSHEATRAAGRLRRDVPETGWTEEYDEGADHPRARSLRTGSHPACRRRHRELAGPTGAGGTATRTSTRSSTARSSATTGSCGAPRGSTRWRPSCSARRTDLKGQDVLEIGAGAAQCSRWLAGPGRAPGGPGPLPPPAPARAADRRSAVPLVQADAGALPFADGSFDLACSAYGALPFVADPVRGAARGAPGAAPGRPLRLLRDPPDPLGLPRRAGPRGPDGRRLLLRPHAVRRAGRAGAARCTSSTTGRSATGCATWWPAGFRLVDLVEPRVARLEHPGVGRLVPAARQPAPGHGDLRVRAGLTGPGPAADASRGTPGGGGGGRLRPRTCVDPPRARTRLGA